MSGSRYCMTCEEYAIGCENHCQFRLWERKVLRPTLLKKRQAMKAERAKSVEKAEILISSAKKNKGQKNLYDRPKRSYERADKNLEKKQEFRRRRVIKNNPKNVIRKFPEN